MGRYSIETSNLIALSYIIDEYHEFCFDYLRLTERTHDRYNTIMSLDALLLYPHARVDRKIRQFFYKYNRELTNLKNHCDFINFMFANFTIYNTVDENCKQFHDYLSRNRGEVNIIIDYLNYLEKLGIKSIVLDEAFDFSKRVYSVSKDFPINHQIYVLENIVPIPSTDLGSVKYKTTSSDYELELKPIKDKPYIRPECIRTKTLKTDPKNLPTEISREETFDKIVCLSKSVYPESQLMNSIMNENLSEEDMQSICNAIADTVEAFKCCRDKKDILDSLKKLQEDIKGMGNKEMDQNTVVHEIIHSDSKPITKALISEDNK